MFMVTATTPDGTQYGIRFTGDVARLLPMEGGEDQPTLFVCWADADRAVRLVDRLRAAVTDPEGPPLIGAVLRVTEAGPGA